MTGAPPAAIGRATPADLPALAGLAAAAPLLRRYGATAAGSLAALERGLAAGDVLLVARAPGGTPIGLAWLVTSRILAGAAYLRLLLVAEGHQAGGIGLALLRAAEAEATPTANHLVLLATRDNARARRFYERHGYRHVGDLPDLAVAGLDEALYWKPLRAPGDRLPV
jgi:GNAT superfamily N-acetyltransferase